MLSWEINVPLGGAHQNRIWSEAAPASPCLPAPLHQHQVLEAERTFPRPSRRFSPPENGGSCGDGGEAVTSTSGLWPLDPLGWLGVGGGNHKHTILRL